MTALAVVTARLSTPSSTRLLADRLTAAAVLPARDPCVTPTPSAQLLGAR